MQLSDFDYHLPPERIAQTPVEPRDASRLMVIDRATDAITHRHFWDIGEYFRPGDVLVLNQTRVIPARLQARKKDTGGAVEILLLSQVDEQRWRALVGGKNVITGVVLIVEKDGVTLEASVEEELHEAERIICFERPLNDVLQQLGETPLPPYITTPLHDAERYQTVYSRAEGSAAAPTAGLHFTGDLLIDLQRSGVKLAYCTLHIGLDTFAPVKDITQHKIHRERALLTPEDAKIINEAKLAGGRIVAVGTTSVRTLETAAIRSLAYAQAGNHPESVMDTLRSMPNGMCGWRPVVAIDEETDLYITPGFEFRAVDVMLTNFHLPKSTLLMLVSAFYPNIKSAYQLAIKEEYRFYSLGDAMLMV